MKRNTPLKPRNPKRKAENFERAYGGEARVLWIQAHPCVACGAKPCHNAHTKGGGAGRKADARWIVPLCATCHDAYHRIGQRTFEMGMGIDLDHEAQVIDARYEQHLATEARKHVGERKP